MMKRIALFTALVTVVILTASCGMSQGIEGRVFDNIYGDPISDITVRLKSIGTNTSGPAIEVTPNKKGMYSIEAKPGRYRVETEDEDITYKRFIQPITIEDKVIEMDLPLEPIVKTWIHGFVAERESEEPKNYEYKNYVSGATIKIDDKEVITNDDGSFEIKYLRYGLKKVSIEADGYKPYNKSYNLSRGESIEYFVLEPLTDIDHKLVSSIKHLSSFKMEILKGSSSEDINESYSATIIEIPFNYMVESNNGTYRYTNSFYTKLNESTSEYVKIEKEEMQDVDSLIKDSVDLIDELGYYISNTDGMAMGEVIGNVAGYSCSAYSFKYDFNGEKYDVNLWVIIDGTLETYPAKVTMSNNNSYLELSLFAFNSFENNEILN